MKLMVIIGLTGGIASGKSTVAKMLKERGAYLIDADQVAREVVEPGEPAWLDIHRWLGDEILLPDRSINREKLAELVFADEVMRQRLNSIVHPRVASRFIERSREIREKEPGAIIVYDIPLLIEAGMHKMVDLVVIVFADKDIRLVRMEKRDGFSREEAERRFTAQMPLEDKKKYADYIIDNNGTLDDTARQLDSIWRKIRAS